MQAIRNAAIAMVALTLCPAWVSAQGGNWADKMFKGENAHDFGSVPRGAMLVHKFTMTNIWAVPLEITNIRASCGCVTATSSAQTIQSRETATLEVTMDARRFTGPKTVTVFITVGPQYTSTATIKVSSNSRADVVFNPGQINFGVVARGQKPTQTIDLEYAGVLEWKVSEINLNGAPVEASFQELYRRPGQVGYRVTATLKADASPGMLKQELLLKTNDPASPQVPVLIEGTVQAALTVVPSTVRMGADLKAGGDMVTKKVVVRGNKPFKIVSIDGLGDGIEADVPTATGAVQIVTFKYKPSQAGDLKKQIKIKTDLDTSPTATVTVEGKVAP